MTKIDKVSTLDLSAIDIASSHEQRSTHINLLLGASAGLLLDYQHYGNPRQPASAHFSPDSRYENGREQSRHGVQFGKMLVRAGDRAGLGDLVAIKPNSIDGIVTELGAINYLNGFGDTQNSYLPLGVLKQANGAAALVTLFEHGITTADNVFWADRDLNPEQLRPERIRTALHDCSWSLGYLHAVGLVQGDAEVKNLAHDGRNARFVDLEDAELLPRKGRELIDSAGAEAMKYTDLDTFIATSLQVEENRPEILRVLTATNAASELGLYYRKGYSKGARDSGLKSHKMTTSESAAYFDSLIQKNSRSLIA